MWKHEITVLVVFVSWQVSVGQQPTVSELMQKFGETNNQLQSFIIKSESDQTFSAKLPDRSGQWQNHTSAELRWDGDRVKFIRSIWGYANNRNMDVPKDDPIYTSHMWDGQQWYQHSKNVNDSRPNHLWLHRNKNNKRNISPINTDPVTGYFGEQRLDAYLTSGRFTQVAVREQTESVGGVPCYVVDAWSPSEGKLTVWIDPQHGYNLAKEEFRMDSQHGGAKEGVTRYSAVTITRFQEVAGVWIPMEAEIESEDRNIESDMYRKSVTHYQRTEVTLNPDHDALGSFLPDDIPNGTHVQIAGIVGLRYIWQDGKLIPNVDLAALAHLDKIADQLLGKSVAAAPPSAAVTEGDAASAMKSVAGRPVSPEIERLLANYAATVDKSRRLLVKAQSTIEYVDAGSPLTTVETEWCEFKTDGKRFCWRANHTKGQVLSTEEPGYKSLLWDGKSLIHYVRGTGSTQATIQKDGSQVMGLISMWYRGAPLLGICPGDDKRVDAIIRDAGTASLAKEQESINGTECFLIEAQTVHGEYRVWIDPEHGYNIAQLQMTQGRGGQPARAFVLANIRFQEIDKVWIPVEAAMELIDNGKTARWQHERAVVRVNPDDSTLGSFAPDDITDGTKVIMSGQSEEDYIWRNGRPLKEARENGSK